VTLPALGESVTEGTVTRWLKRPGDKVEVDEPLLEVSTDKVDTEIPSPVAGVLVEIKVAEDETVEVGAELATIGPEGAQPQQEQPQQQEQQQQAPSAEKQPPEEPEAEKQPEQAASTEQRETAPGQGDTPRSDREESGTEDAAKAESEAAQRQEAPTPAPSPGQAPSQAPSQGDGRQERQPSEDGAAYVTPLVRKLAAEHDVDLAKIEGSGVGGRIRKQDVLDAAKAQESAPAPSQQEPAAAAAPSGGPSAAPVEPSPLRGKTEKMSRLRKVIAARMVESLQTSAQLTTVVEVDVTAIARLRQKKKEEFLRREGVKLSFTPFFAKAVVDSLKGHPKLNAAIDVDKGEITYFDAEHLGIAVDTERGLLVATVKDAGDLSIAGLARKIDDVGRRTRENQIKPDELQGATFTLTNTGSRGALFDTPIINQPQVGILGTGAVVKRPVVIDDPNLGETIAVRHMCYFALTYDHRLVDGADAARFLGEVKQRLEHGSFDV
jgi:pyruvate dehydrogenase E2 component (dihydrolipoamide acetyltransferase)